MIEFLKTLFTEAELDNLFVIAGLAFLGIAIVGKIIGKIDPGKSGRIAAGLIGPALIIVGLVMHETHVSPPLGGVRTQGPAAGALAPPQFKLKPPPQSGHMSASETDKNRQGNDFLHFTAASVERCKRVCEEEDRCKAMTFVLDPAAGGQCWLKDRVPAATEAAGMISAIKLPK
jgi:hypothetical protein